MVGVLRRGPRGRGRQGVRLADHDSRADDGQAHDHRAADDIATAHDGPADDVVDASALVPEDEFRAGTIGFRTLLEIAPEPGVF